MNKEQFIEELKICINSKRKRKYLLKCIAECCETSYRRGVQQTLCFKKEDLKKRFHNSAGLDRWRFSDKTKCVGLDGYKTTAIDRFFIEHEEWQGFDD